jgi:hypothetical protein
LYPPSPAPKEKNEASSAISLAACKFYS